MGKVDCIVEMREEEFNNGYDKGILDTAKNLLLEGIPVEDVIKYTKLPLSKVEDLKSKLNI